MAASSVTNGSTVADIYARALFELAQEHDAIAEVADELAGLCDLLKAEPDLAALFAHRTIVAERRAASLDTIFEGRISDLTLRFLQVLNANGRLGLLEQVAGSFDQMIKHAHGEVDVEVHSARQLDDAQLSQVGEKIGQAIGKKVLVEPHVDQSLIGGLRIRIGDKLIDASVRNKLKRIQDQLTQRGHELVRTKAAQLLAE